MKKFFIFMAIIVVSGCTTPFYISDRPSYNVLDQFKNKFQTKDKIVLEIDQASKNLSIAKRPSGIFGTATTYVFNIGEAFSGNLSEIVNSIFVKNVSNPLKLYITITSCDFSYANIMFHNLAWAEIDMTISIKYSSSNKELKTSNFKYHSRVDIPFSERDYVIKADKAAVLSINQIIEQLLSDILNDINEIAFQK